MAAMKAAKHQKVLYPFTENTPLYMLVKKEYRTTLAAWLKFIAPCLSDGEPEMKTCKHLNFTCRNEKMIWCIAILLVKLNGEGLNCKKSVFFRYLTTNEHTNISFNEGQLKTLVNSYIRQGLLPMN